MSAAYSGAFANVLSGTLDMDAQGWSCDYEVATFDSSTTADAGWTSTTPSLKKVSGSFDFFYNPLKKPTGAASGMTPGNYVAFTGYIDKAVDPGDTVTGSALILKLSLKSKVTDGFMITASFTSNGAWVFPS